MGTEAAEMTRMAVDAVIAGDASLAHEVIRMDDLVDNLERQALLAAVGTVMQEAPVAADLRFLISTIGIIGEIEKAGDDAVKLARRATKLTGVFPSEMKVALSELGELSRRSFTSSLRLYADYSNELAEEIIHLDMEVDQTYARARNRVFELIKQDPASTEHLVRTIDAFHALEHVADHAVAIAQRMKILHDRPEELLSIAPIH